MKTLHLSLKKEWYEMIESGVKTEEYREIKPYWESRIRCQAYGMCTPNKPCLRARTVGVCDMRYTHIKFSYGYTKRTMTFECKGIAIGKGHKEWGAPDEDVFIIKLGKRIK